MRLALLVAAATLAVFARAIGNDWVAWDDDSHFLRNPHYRGLGWPQIRWMLTTAFAHWNPVAWLTLGLDYSLWGMNPAGYHFTSVLIHAANAALAFLVARRLLTAARPTAPGRARDAAALAAALCWALHPLRVESVVWITERRDVLSGFFALATVLAYLAMVDARDAGRRRWWLISIALYALGLLSKSMLVSLPIVLLILDAYPLRRAARLILREKIPYAAMAAVILVVTTLTVRAGFSLTSLEAYPPQARVAMALHSFAFYIAKTILPIALSPLYELPARVDPLAHPFLPSALAVAGITLLALQLRASWPAGLAAWLAYVVMILPVSGLVHVGPQLVADRFSYLPSLAGALLLGGAVSLAWDRGRRWAAGVTVAVAAWIVVLAALTWEQTAVWRSTTTLWEHAIAAEPGCARCHTELAIQLASRGDLGGAIDHFREAVELRPDRINGHGNLALALLRAGRSAEAIPHLERVLAASPTSALTRARLGAALLQEKRLAEADRELRRALRDEPDNAEALTGLGALLIAQGRPAEAVPHLVRAVERDPSAPLPRALLAEVQRAAHQRTSPTSRR